MKLIKQIVARLSIFLITLIAAHSVYSQSQYIGKPQYEKIKANIFDSGSSKFYPSLYDKYMNGDTSLTIDDFRHLYYGYTFQSKYVPYKESKYEPQMMGFLRKGKLSSAEVDEFIKIAKLKLQELPYDIRTLNILAFSYAQKGDSVMNAIYKFKKEMLVKAILSTGNGKTEGAAFHVIDPVHERDILNELGLRFATSSNLANALCDYLVVLPNEKNIRGVYFDISRLLKVKAERQNN